MQAAFHQCFRAPGTHFRDRFLGRFLAERRLNDWVAGDLESGLRSDFPNARRGTDQNGRYQAGLGGIDGASERILVAGMRDSGGRRRQILAALNQPVVPFVFFFHDTSLSVLGIKISTSCAISRRIVNQGDWQPTIA
jgi:hypothetical protein